jgi:hypothetical protein
VKGRKNDTQNLTTTPFQPPHNVLVSLHVSEIQSDDAINKARRLRPATSQITAKALLLGIFHKSVSR